MPVVCFNRPNRSKPRLYTEQDLARIAGYVNDSGVPWFTILGVIAVSGGFAYLLCRVLSLIDMAEDVRRWLADVVDVASLVTAINVLIKILQVGTAIPIARRFVAFLISFLLASLVFLRRIARWQDELEDAVLLNNIRKMLSQACSAAEDRIQYLLDRGERDKISDEDFNHFKGDIPNA